MPGIASAATAVVVGSSGGGHVDDPGRGGRDHAPEPLAARDRGAVRDARVALPRPDRPRPRPGAGNRPAHGAGAATRPGERAGVPAGRAGAPVPARARAAGPGDPRGSRRGDRSAALDPRLEHVRGAARGGARASLRLRLALRAGRRCTRRLPSTGASSGRRSSSRRRTRWRGSTSSRPRPTRRRAGSSRRRSRRGRTGSAASPGPYPPPIDDIEAYWTPAEKAQASSMLAYSVVGSPETVRGRRRGASREHTGVDELMVVSAIYDHGARVRSYEILAEAASPARGPAAPATTSTCDESQGHVTRRPPGGVERAWKR